MHEINITLMILETINSTVSVMILMVITGYVGFEIKEWVADKWRNRHAGGE
jgi:hypothetical protein